MGKWVKDNSHDDVHHYYRDDERARQREEGGTPLFGDALLERGEYEPPSSRPFWYVVVWGAEPALTGHFFEEADARKWAEERVAEQAVGGRCTCDDFCDDPCPVHSKEKPKRYRFEISADFLEDLMKMKPVLDERRVVRHFLREDGRKVVPVAVELYDGKYAGMILNLE